MHRHSVPCPASNDRHLCIKHCPECSDLTVQGRKGVQGRSAESDRSLLRLPCFPAWGEGESGLLWLLSWRISPAQIILFTLWLLRSNVSSKCLCMTHMNKFIFSIFWCQYLCLTHHSDQTCYLLFMLGDLPDLLPHANLMASTIKEKNICRVLL